jgi:serine-type D-Ala-D-Ala carboxypeptidase/endopeptidase
VAMRDLFPKSFAALAYTEVRAKEMKRTEPPVASADPALYDAYVGDYRLENGVVFSILRRGDRLMLDAEPIGTAELYPESASRVFLRITNFQVNFLRGGDGKVQEVLGRMNGRDLTGKRTK